MGMTGCTGRAATGRGRRQAADSRPIGAVWETETDYCKTQRRAESDSSAVVRRDVVPQPVLAFRVAARGGVVPLILGGLGKGIAENVVN